jgi:hypothetical protein
MHSEALLFEVFVYLSGRIEPHGLILLKLYAVPPTCKRALRRARFFLWGRQTWGASPRPFTGARTPTKKPAELTSGF